MPTTAAAQIAFPRHFMAGTEVDMPSSSFGPGKSVDTENGWSCFRHLSINILNKSAGSSVGSFI